MIYMKYHSDPHMSWYVDKINRHIIVKLPQKVSNMLNAGVGRKEKNSRGSLGI